MHKGDYLPPFPESPLQAIDPRYSHQHLTALL